MRISFAGQSLTPTASCTPPALQTFAGKPDTVAIRFGGEKAADEAPLARRTREAVAHVREKQAFLKSADHATLTGLRQSEDASDWGRAYLAYGEQKLAELLEKKTDDQLLDEVNWLAEKLGQDPAKTNLFQLQGAFLNLITGAYAEGERRYINAHADGVDIPAPEKLEGGSLNLLHWKAEHGDIDTDALAGLTVPSVIYCSHPPRKVEEGERRIGGDGTYTAEDVAEVDAYWRKQDEIEYSGRQILAEHLGYRHAVELEGLMQVQDLVQTLNNVMESKHGTPIVDR